MITAQHALLAAALGGLVCLAAMAPLRAQEGEPDLPPVNFASNITNTGSAAAVFLTIGVGARAQAMGNAAVAISKDAAALYWNPAAIAGLSHLSLIVDHTQWLADTDLNFVGAVFPLPRIGAFGVSVLSLQAIDNQPVRTILQPEGTGEFYSASDLALAATLAIGLTDRFALGISGKYIRQALWNEAASTFAFDLGIVYQTQFPGLKLAASLVNFGGDLQMSGRDLLRPFDDDPANYSNDRLNVLLKTDRFSLPLYFRFGIGLTLLNRPANTMMLAADLLHPSDNSESMNLGFEYTAWQTISLRGGLRSLFETDRFGGLSFGLGLSRPLIGGLRLRFDYSYADWGLLEETRRFSIGLGY